MHRLLPISLLFLLATLPLAGQTKGAKVPYRIEFDPGRDVSQVNEFQGKKGLFVKVWFSVAIEGEVADDAEYKVIVEEDGRKVKEEDVPRPRPAEELSTVLAMDTSGSMSQANRMAQARTAANVFLNKLPASADCGLILFDHEIRPPVLTPLKDRAPLRAEIQKVLPRGGTAYLDAAKKGIEMLFPFAKREKAVVIITDGIDLGSQTTISEVIAQAKKARVRLYTVGIGEPGRMEQVHSVLVLDHSGSMKPPAEEQDTTPKIKALHRAASGFIRIMPASARVSLVPFSSQVGLPTNFTNMKTSLLRDILNLKPAGETALFDAIDTALSTLEAENPKGKRVVVAMTDGVDNSSRRRVEEVIAHAKAAKIPLFLLGFGRQGELDSKTLTRMAEETKGKFYHAKNEKALVDIFENLSIQIHDDGIDEASLTRLARETGGQFYLAKDVNKLQLILEQVTQNIQKKSYEITYQSLRQVADGTQRNISLKLVRRSGELVSNTPGGTLKSPKEEVLTEQKGSYQTRGVVIAEMDHRIYLGLLSALGLLIALPGLLKKKA